MASTRAIRGDVAQADQPSWSALEAVLGAELARWFMWMYEVRLNDGTRIDVYKHTTTRRYLHLSTDLHAYAYQVDGHYVSTGLVSAITAAFDGWARVEPPADEREQLSVILGTARDIAA